MIPDLAVVPVVPVVYLPKPHNPNFLSEGRRVLHSAKKATMGSTLTYVPLSPFLLGAAIDPLSQEIYKKLLVEASAETSILSGRFGKKSNPVHSSIWSTDTE